MKLQLLLILSLRYIISFVSNIFILSLHSSNVEKQRGLTIELFLVFGCDNPIWHSSHWTWFGSFFFSLFFCFLFFYQIVFYLKFIIYTFYHYYYLLLSIYFVQFTPCKKQNELCNHFVEGHPSSIKFTIDLASHVLHGLLGTMVTVSVVVSSLQVEACLETIQSNVIFVAP